jgi:hypothetical protein
MSLQTTTAFLAACFLSLTLAKGGVAQVRQMRSITSDDFASQRPPEVKKDPAARRNVRHAAGVTRAVKRTYKFVRVEAAALPPVKRRATPSPPKEPATITEIGITIWKMRLPRPSERGLLLLTGESKGWVAERVNSDAFALGDRIRIGIESSKFGYLYLVDREIFMDGTVGKPILIFPESPQDDNAVFAGGLFDVPDQMTDPAYFTIAPRSQTGPSLSGDQLTVIISASPLTKLAGYGGREIRNTDLLTEIERAAENEVFRRTDSADKIYSRTEAEAVCGGKTRGLLRPGPCSETTKPLTREGPMPQSIYRVKGYSGHPVAAFVKVAITQ